MAEADRQGRTRHCIVADPRVRRAFVAARRRSPRPSAISRSRSAAPLVVASATAVAAMAPTASTGAPGIDTGASPVLRRSAINAAHVEAYMIRRAIAENVARYT